MTGLVSVVFVLLLTTQFSNVSLAAEAEIAAPFTAVLFSKTVFLTVTSAPEATNKPAPWVLVASPAAYPPVTCNPSNTTLAPASTVMQW